jgi:hypothetical protein
MNERENTQGNSGLQVHLNGQIDSAEPQEELE